MVDTDKKKTPQDIITKYYDIFFLIICIIIIITIIIIIGIFLNKQCAAALAAAAAAARVAAADTINSERLFEFILQYFIVILYILLIIVIIDIMSVAFILKEAYEFGENLEKQCDGVFVEKERGDHAVYSKYIKNIQGTNCSNVFSDDIENRLKNSYYIIVSIVLLTIIWSIIQTVSFLIKNRALLPFQNYESEKSLRVIVPLCLIAATHGLLAYYWMDLMVDPLNPFTGLKTIQGSIEIMEPIMRSHITILVLILICILFVLYFTEQNDKSLYAQICFLFVALLIIISLFIKSANGFQINIKDKYGTAVTSINDTLSEDYIKQNELVRKELEKNIMLDESASNAIIPSRIDLLDKTTFEKYKCSLFSYLPHIDDMKNLRGIPIPQELKSIIEHSFLAGDQSIEFKNELISLYYKYKINNELMTTESLKNETIKLYLKNDFREQIEEGRSTEIVKLINTHVILNDTFKKGNPLPSDIIQQLRKLREDTSIKDTVNGYYDVISVISYILLIIIAYAVYRLIFIYYREEKQILLQYVSLFAIVLLAIIGFVGWWAKEMWL